MSKGTQGHRAWIRGLAVLCLGSAVGTCPADAIDDLVRAEMRRQHIPGVAIAVVREGRITKAKGYGVADLDHNVPVTPDTVFALASITKQFTATLIMVLVEQGKVRLDDEIGQYLDDPPANWKGITVRHLLNHTGGLSPLGKDFVSLVRSPNSTTAQMYEAAKGDPIGGKPGEKWDYSDVGYFLLGMIIERASGRTYPEFLRETILDPTGMKTARMADLNRPYRNLARGYTRVRTAAGWETQNIRRDSQRGLTSHYGLFGTVKDLAKWDAALQSGNILKADRLQQMWTPAKLNHGSTFPYGFGWNLAERNGHRYHHHSGITGTFILRIPSLRLCVIVLTNLGRWASGRSRGADAYLIAHAIAAQAERRFAWKPLEKQDASLIAKARAAFESLSAGRLPEAQFSKDAIASLSEDLEEFPTWYRELGPIKRVELVGRLDEFGETLHVFSFSFAKGKRIFTIGFDGDQKVAGFFPDA